VSSETPPVAHVAGSRGPETNNFHFVLWGFLNFRNRCPRVILRRENQTALRTDDLGPLGGAHYHVLIHCQADCCGKLRKADSTKAASGRRGNSKEVHREPDFGFLLQLEEWSPTIAIEHLETFLASIA
jgi:hypothetical protein